MKFSATASLKKAFLSLFFLSLGLVFAVDAKDASKDKIQFASENLTLDMGGRFITESYASGNLALLNKKHIFDNIFYIRSTADYFFMMTYKQHDLDRIMFYDAVRFRYKWGTATEVKNEDSFATIVDVKQPVKGSTANKHLLWIREGWLKVKLGDNPDLNHYIQLGLIPYQVGRGISLGAAYDAPGFIAFTPGNAIDQFAPGFVISFNPIKDRFVNDFYVALIENKQTSLDSNLEVIREGEIQGACPQRGIGRQSYILSWRADVLAFEKDKKKVNIEPYIVHQHAPDQDLEFKNDVNTYLSTMGCAVEGTYNKFNWGFETAANFGEIDIRPWDRNQIKIIRTCDGFLREQYTKVYTQNPAAVKKPDGAPVTDAVKQLLKGSPKDVSLNGQEIGTVDIDGDLTAIYNAFDRIRPEQRRLLRGYFMVADFTYEMRPKELNLSFGVGYASGNIDPQRDVNHETQDQLMNQKFTGFIPLQSIYSGKRLRHLVIFNQGVPRFNVRVPNADLSQKNVTAVLQTDTLNEMTNIAFTGTRIDWRVPQLKTYSAMIATNVIAYWAPEVAEYILVDNTLTSTLTEAQILQKTKNPLTNPASNYIGTEISVEYSALFYDKLKLMGYMGVLLPGQHYKDMCGTKFGKNNLETGSDWGYVANVNLTYIF